MKELINRISEAGLVLDLKEGALQIFATQEDVDSNLVAEIKSAKEELTKYLLQHNEMSLEKEQYQDIPKCKKEESYPLSNAQLRLWLADQLGGSAAGYNMPNTIALNGSYHLDNFRKAVHAVVKRHEVLRTVFRVDHTGEVRQYILSPEELGFAINFKNFQKEENPETALRSFISSDSVKPFDLAEGPLIRAGLFQLSKDQYFFYFNMHHIISDGWSLNILSRDVMEFYQAFESGATPDIPSLRIQYKDYASWQLAQLESEASNKHKEYWLSKLSGEIPVLDLPTVKGRPPVKTYNGKKLSTRIDPKITADLRRFASEKGGSLFMGLIAGLKVLLYQYTGQTDITIGNTITGRDHEELENQIGFYINFLILRNQLNPSKSFSDFFEQIKSNTLEAYQHQAYPFDKLIEDLNLYRDLSREPIADFKVNYFTTPQLSPIADYQEIRDSGNGSVKSDFELTLAEDGTEVEILLTYNQDIYEQEMIASFLMHYKELLKRLLKEPELSIAEVEYLLEEEKNTLLYKFNDTEKPFPENKTIVDLFEDQVKKTPQNIALVTDDVEITYAELNEKVNLVADQLLNKYNIEIGEIIGLSLSKSEKAVISILAILKCGAAYLPLDISYPEERLSYMIKDSNVRLIIKSKKDNIAQQETNDLFIENLLQNSENSILQNPNRSITPEDIAYVIYTSGSTGKPKGVMVRHKGNVNMSLDQVDLLNVQSTDRVVWFASMSFDASVSEIMMAMYSGASLLIPQNEITKDVNVFSDWLKKNKATTITFPPSYLDLFKVEQYSFLRCILTAGEAAHPEKAREVVENGVVFFNAYGPTECSVCVSMFRLNKAEDLKSVPIGKPIANMKCYVLNNHQHLVPVGVEGRLYVSGVGLAKGYLNKPDMTNERFFENPYLKEEKMYDTGDIVKWLPNGELEFVGRKDEQVKLRGYRIELGEIEKIVSDIQEISQVFVMVQNEKRDDAYLVGYYSKMTPNALSSPFYISSDHEETEGTNSPDSKSIVEHLKAKLPEYMVPKIWMELDRFPFTPNGKVDRKALPVPDDNAYVKQEYVEPSGTHQIEIAKMWQAVLNIEKIGANDNFFELGGHSMLAMKLSFAMTKLCGSSVEINKIFKYPTIKLQAQYLDILNVKSGEGNLQNEEVVYF